MTFDYLLLLRLLTALVCGGIIGFERGGNHHEAGLRTHMLLSLGSALVMVTSISLAEYYNIPAEVMRMSAQIISGIGFLGAGSIIADGNKIRGITTAAGLWTTACVGITVGAGFYVLAGFTVLLVLFIMIVLNPLSARLKSSSTKRKFHIELKNKAFLQEFIENISRKDTKVINLEFKKLENGHLSAILQVSFSKKTAFVMLMSKLAESEEIISFKEVE